MYKDKDYKNIFYLVCNHQLLGHKKYQEFVPYEHILRLLFCNISMIKDLSRYVKECIDLINRVPEPLYNLDPVLISFCNNIHNPFKTIDQFEVIFFPDEVMNEDEGYNLGFYLSTMHALLTNAKYPINYSFRYDKFNNLFQYFKEVFNSNVDVCHHMDVVVTLLSYIYLNNLDFKIVDEYISDPDYYNEYINMTGIILNENNIGNYYSVMYKRLFENANKLFNKNKILIK